ncbi:MAG: hypothetical protein GY861_05445 [bacterium]|nr:hypothetical protein [bacterium]
MKRLLNWILNRRFIFPLLSNKKKNELIRLMIKDYIKNNPERMEYHINSVQETLKIHKELKDQFISMN